MSISTTVPMETRLSFQASFFFKLPSFSSSPSVFITPSPVCTSTVSFPFSYYILIEPIPFAQDCVQYCVTILPSFYSIILLSFVCFARLTLTQSIPRRAPGVATKDQVSGADALQWLYVLSAPGDCCPTHGTLDNDGFCFGESLLHCMPWHGSHRFDSKGFPLGVWCSRPLSEVRSESHWQSAKESSV